MSSTYIYYTVYSNTLHFRHAFTEMRTLYLACILQPKGRARHGSDGAEISILYVHYRDCAQELGAVDRLTLLSETQEQ